jgi:hypothetical protein
MKVTKLAALTLASILSLGLLTSCSSNTETTTPAESPAETTTTPTEGTAPDTTTSPAESPSPETSPQ